MKDYLWNHSATGVAYDGSSRTLPTRGWPRSTLARLPRRYFGVPVSDPRHPDVWGVVQVGVVYTGGTKIAEHGGANPADRDVPILVYAPGTVEPGTHRQWVETTQIAPTILDLLGLNPKRSKRSRSKVHARCPASPATDRTRCGEAHRVTVFPYRRRRSADEPFDLEVASLLHSRFGFSRAST